MAQQYSTIETEVITEIEEKKSRFIAYLVPYKNFEARLDDLRTGEHRKATHHVTAFRTMGSEDRVVEGAKDDGEPAGTSGMPILRVLMGRDLIDVGVIVVRYFGGTKLGTGGLARAYSGAAIKAIDEAELIPWVKLITRTIEAGFAESSVIEAAISEHDLTVISRDYTESGVTYIIKGPEAAVTAIEV